MSRHTIWAAYVDHRYGEICGDDSCTIGWDGPMNTYFFQSGAEVEDQGGMCRPFIWIGGSPNEFPNLDEFLVAIRNVFQSPDLEGLLEALEAESQASQ